MSCQSEKGSGISKSNGEERNKLVFDQDSSGKDTSYIQNKRTNEKICLRLENGVYVLDLTVAPPQRSNDRSADPHFHLTCKPD